jgi:hypothetical protein
MNPGVVLKCQSEGNTFYVMLISVVLVKNKNLLLTGKCLIQGMIKDYVLDLRGIGQNDDEIAYIWIGTRNKYQALGLPLNDEFFVGFVYCLYCLPQ